MTSVNHNVQALRAIAAYLVVGHHIIFTLRDYFGAHYLVPNLKFGSSGVPIFFVISGYIMMSVAAGRPPSPLQFAWHRIVRIVPTYWLLTAVAVVGIDVIGLQIFGLRSVDSRAIFTSLFFLPDIRDGNPAVDPILYVGWSLNFEIMFYLIFCFCLFFREAFPRFVAVIAAIIALWIAGYVSASPYLRYYGSNIVLAFAAGGCIWFATTRFKVPRSVSAVIFCLAWAGIAWPDFSPSSSESVKSFVTIVAATAIVYSAVSLNDQGITVGDGILSEQGTSSYALYLVHPFVLQLFSKLARNYIPLSPIPLAIGAACLFVASVVAAMVFYRFVEVPLTRLLRSRRSAVRASTEPTPLPS